ncbi:MAG TPA: high frequency lysogenization protein HflD [Gammaproteobacteria bacterium]|nr:high frequency lysogenization protein HflD [Gammaproteobacteria bacterium]
MTYSLEDRVLALAGLVQAVWLTDRVAYLGDADEAAVDASLGSLFTFDAPNVPAVFGGRGGVRRGLEILCRVLDNRGKPEDLRLTRYLVALAGHAQRSMRQPDLMDAVRRGLERAEQQKRHFEDWDANVVATLADVYVRTIGTLEPRIMISGEPARLQNPRNVDSIRALLLAGLRAAVLWQQTGGRKWQLVFSRRKLREAAERLLA